MMEHEAQIWFRIAQSLYVLKEPLARFSAVAEAVARSDGDKGLDDFRVSERAAFEVLLEQCGQLQLTMTCTAIRRYIAEFDNASVTQIARMAHIKDIEQRLMDELEATLFLCIPRERASYYRNTLLFGGSVADAFPEASFDIEEAGKCFATGRGTGCVFHLMRVMEVFLRYLARLLKISYAPSWGAYITQIEVRINAKHKTKGVQWKRDEPFFRDILGELTAVKIAWRNPTMHVHGIYTLEEAENIFGAVRSVGRRLATRKQIGRT
jgi:hypothetical protein